MYFHNKHIENHSGKSECYSITITLILRTSKNFSKLENTKCEFRDNSAKFIKGNATATRLARVQGQNTGFPFYLCGLREGEIFNGHFSICAVENRFRNTSLILTSSLAD